MKELELPPINTGSIPLPHIGRDWWYIVTKDKEGKTVLLGPYGEDKEAEQIALAKTTQPYEVISLPTRNLAKATQMWRHQMLNKPGGTLQDSLQRMRHKL